VLPPERLAEFRLAHTLVTDTNDLGILHALLRALTERLGRRLRRGGLAVGRLRVDATYADHTAVARALPLRASTLDAELYDAARRAFALANSKRLAVRTVEVTLDRLLEAEAQLELFNGATALQGYDATVQALTTDSSAHPGSDAPPPSAVAPYRRSGVLQHTLDRIRTRYGTRALGINHVSPR
jgi:hypothetical protein